MRFVKRLKGRISAGTPQLFPTGCHFTGTSPLFPYHFFPPIGVTPFRIWARDNGGVTDGHGMMNSEFLVLSSS